MNATTAAPAPASEIARWKRSARPMAVAARVLERAAALVETGWTQDAYAVTMEGEEVNVCSPRACAWCATGAIHAASAGRMNFSAAYALILDVSRRLKATTGVALAAWNDHPDREPEEVALFLRAQALRSHYCAIRLLAGEEPVL